MKQLLVLGCGNTLRRDDGAGPEVVRRLETLGLDELETVATHQLLPEHAEAIAGFRRVVFVDACLKPGPTALRIGRIEAGELDGFTLHQSSPEEILALAARLYDHVPEAWLITIPAHDLDIGDGLSDEVDRCCDEAVDEIRRLWETAQPLAS